jgi:hypothetical protein
MTTSAQKKLHITCPTCNQRLRVSNAHFMKRVLCPHCHTAFQVDSFQAGTVPTTAPRSDVTQHQQASRQAAGHQTAVKSPADGEPSIGKIGRFELKQILGKSGFGVVYRAHDPVLGRLVALRFHTFRRK